MIITHQCHSDNAHGLLGIVIPMAESHICRRSYLKTTEDIIDEGRGLVTEKTGKAKHDKAAEDKTDHRRYDQAEEYLVNSFADNYPCSGGGYGGADETRKYSMAR